MKYFIATKILTPIFIVASSVTFSAFIVAAASSLTAVVSPKTPNLNDDSFKFLQEMSRNGAIAMVATVASFGFVGGSIARKLEQDRILGLTIDQDCDSDFQQFLAAQTTVSPFIQQKPDCYWELIDETRDRIRKDKCKDCKHFYLGQVVRCGIYTELQYNCRNYTPK